jgi:tetratricopeptide (TPR) repeat protein
MTAMRTLPIFAVLMWTAVLTWTGALTGCLSPKPDPEKQAVDHYVRGQMLLSDGNLDGALQELARATRLDPTLATAHSAMGDIYRQQQDFPMAENAYTLACDVNPYNFRNHYNLGVIRQALASAALSGIEMQEYLRKAVEVYLRAITLHGDDFDANLNLGVCYYQMGQLDKAEQYCKAAIAIDPDHPYAYTNLGAVYDGQGKLYEAVSSYKKSLELDTNQPKVLINLASAYIKQGRFKSAIIDYELAAKMDPQSPVPLERLGYCHYFLQDYAKAVECYQLALEVNKRYAEARRGLGVVYMTQYLLDKSQAPLLEKALAEWNVSLEIKPDQRDLSELVRKYTPRYNGPQL